VILVWLGAVIIGLSLGLLGSGGSILTVPVLVYLVREPQKLAIAESLAIVGGISFVGAFPYIFKKHIHWKSVLWFGIPGIAGTYMGAYVSQWLSGGAQLLLFALIMLVAAYTMWRAKDPKAEHKHQAYWQIVLEGLAVGMVTGLVGVGGGFLIIPALVLLGGLPMRLAVGTSLLIIALKSFVGFYKYMHVLSEYQVNWSLIGLFVVLGIVGSFTGSFLSQKLPQGVLRKLFASVLIVLGIFILYQNLPSLLGYTVNVWTLALVILLIFMLMVLLSKAKEGISVEELSHLSDVILIDVREQDEYREGHVAKSKNVPLSQLSQRLNDIPNDKPVFLICRSGRRSGQALKILREAGYANVQSIRGGMMAWQLAQLPIVKGKDKTALLK
jgi:uncharacterized membrane protein YfcA/rhodanese-related sulfurtransferase